MGYMATTNKKLWWKVNLHVKLNQRRQVFEIIAHTSVIVAVRNFSYAVPEKAELFLIKTLNGRCFSHKLKMYQTGTTASLLKHFGVYDRLITYT